MGINGPQSHYPQNYSLTREAKNERRKGMEKKEKPSKFDKKTTTSCYYKL